LIAYIFRKFLELFLSIPSYLMLRIIYSST
jgi:hypothetical protein